MEAVTEIQPGDPSYATFVGWLENFKLPTRDLSEGETRVFALTDGTGSPISFAALSGSGEHSLLRSVVADPAHQKSGAGRRVVSAIEEIAKAEGKHTLWLLTEGAAPFFSRLGWAVVERDEAPTPIARSSQFTSVCPASASLMRKTL